MKNLMIRRLAILLLMTAVFTSGCGYQFKSHSQMTDREKAQAFSILQEDGAAGLTYDQFNMISESR